MKVLGLVLMIVVSTFAFKSESMSRAAQKQIADLQSTEWGRTIIEMAELHALAGGAVQELVDGIEELLDDLNNDLQELEFNYNVRTNEHNSLVISLEQQIQDAQIDIQRSDDTVENLLKPRRAQLREKVKQTKEYMEQNRKVLAESELVRSQEHAAFEAQIEEYNAATGAVDEALALLGTLSNPSLVQIKKINSSLKKIQQKIKAHSVHETMIKALISLASEQNFADQDIIRTIVNHLNDFRVSIVDAINDATVREADTQAEHEDHVDQLNAEFSGFQRTVTQINIDLTAVSEKLDQFIAFIAQRDSDRKSYVAQLDLENNSYAEESDIFANLKSEYLREIAVSEQALQLVNSVDFSNIGV